MAVAKCPEVEFSYSGWSSWRARARLKRAIYESLPRNSIVRRSWMLGILGSVEINNHEFCVSYRRVRIKRNMRLMRASVTPMDFLGTVPYLKNPEVPREYIPDMMVICNCIDNAIRAERGVDMTRWYFTWRGVDSKSVQSLQDLSWDE